MLNVRLAGDQQYGKVLFTWLSLVMSCMMSLMLSFSHEMSWMRSGTELSQFLRVFLSKSRKENPQKLTQLSSRSHPRHLMGKRQH